jgi:hypothetical protein
MEREEQRPEGKLIELAIERKELSVRAAAELLKMSDSRLGQIIRGYETPREGTRVPVVAPAKRLVKIALGLDITPEEYEEAERPDAAAALRARLKASPPAVNAAPAWDIGWNETAGLRDELLEVSSQLQGLAGRLEEIAGRGGGDQRG